MLRIWDSAKGSGGDRLASGAKSEGREGKGIGAGKEAIARKACRRTKNGCMFGQWHKLQQWLRRERRNVLFLGQARYLLVYLPRWLGSCWLRQEELVVD